MQEGWNLHRMQNIIYITVIITGACRPITSIARMQRLPRLRLRRPGPLLRVQLGRAPASTEYKGGHPKMG